MQGKILNVSQWSKVLLSLWGIVNNGVFILFSEFILLSIEEFTKCLKRVFNLYDRPAISLQIRLRYYVHSQSIKNLFQTRIALV